ncbi:MAG: hypothetical protein QXS20_08010 [Candidatus Thorarchaeota archaeon]
MNRARLNTLLTGNTRFYMYSNDQAMDPTIPDAVSPPHWVAVVVFEYGPGVSIVGINRHHDYPPGINILWEPCSQAILLQHSRYVQTQ